VTKRISLTWDDVVKGGTLICSVLAAAWVLFAQTAAVREDISLLRTEIQHVISEGERVTVLVGEHADDIHSHDVRLTVLEATP
jgi:hypothetical protein